MKLNLQLSCYNGARYLPYLFASLKKQTRQGWHLFVLDNASRDEDRIGIQKAVAESGLPITLFRLEKNIGFAGAHNFLFEKHKVGSELVQLLNDDAILEPTYLEKVADYLEDNSECAAASGLIYRWDFEFRDRIEGGKMVILDSLGLGVKATGKVEDLGAGKMLPNNFVFAAHSVFGVSGCLPMYKTSAVNWVSFDGPLFDASYVIYKEDVDLAFRLQTAGFKAALVSGAVAYHRRSLGVGSKVKPSYEAHYGSYRNHLWLVAAHLGSPRLPIKSWAVIPFEAAKLGYWLIRSPKIAFGAWRETFKQWPRLKEKRKFMKSVIGKNI
ncbi:MAG: glycosyltransferase family 2 protein [bacterium]